MYKSILSKFLLQNILTKMINFLNILLKYFLYIIFLLTNFKYKTYLKLNLLSLLILTHLDY